MAKNKKENTKKMALKLNPLAFGLGWGILTGLCVFLTTLFAIYTPEETGKQAVNIVESVYGPFGYSSSFLGGILGGIYSLIDMFLVSGLFALIYNKLSEKF